MLIAAQRLVDRLRHGPRRASADSRPTRCLAYTCRELEAELSLRGALEPLRRLRGQVKRRRQQLTQALAASALPAMQAP